MEARKGLVRRAKLDSKIIAGGCLEFHGEECVIGGEALLFKGEHTVLATKRDISMGTIAKLMS